MKAAIAVALAVSLELQGCNQEKAGAKTHAQELTKEDWDEKTAGKTVFVKFLAPWCGHCKKLKPEWDKLMADYAGHDSILIADVDCTAAGKELCEEVGVQGYPTLKFGDPNNLEDYEGGRDFDALSKFAKEKLGPVCGPDHLEVCINPQKMRIEKFMDMPIADLKGEIAEHEARLAAAEKDFEKFVQGLQSKYEEGQKEKDAKKAAIKESGLGLMKSVAAHRKKAQSEL